MKKKVTMLDNSFLNFSLLTSGLVVDIPAHFVMVQCYKLMLSTFLQLWFLLFGCFVYRQNVTCLKHFIRCGH